MWALYTPEHVHLIPGSTPRTISALSARISNCQIPTNYSAPDRDSTASWLEPRYLHAVPIALLGMGSTILTVVGVMQFSTYVGMGEA